MRLFSKLVFAAVSLTLVAPSAQAAKIFRQHHYYSISGKTAAQLDQALARKGPYLESTGSHHPGATHLRFAPQIKLGQTGKYCKVRRANINVYAKVSLPRWKQRNSTRSPELAIIWDVLSHDIKRHEESHIVIARSTATEMERRIRALRYRSNCQQLQGDINNVVQEELIHHDAVQARFDRVEGGNFEKRFARLLVHRLNNLELHARR